MVGMNSTAALKMVQLRPPNVVTAKVYGNRISELISPGTATSWKSWSVVNGKPSAGSLVATMLQISQTEKPMCSATIDQIRLRRATNLPVEFQKLSSSGFQSDIQVAFSLLMENFLSERAADCRDRTRPSMVARSGEAPA